MPNTYATWNPSDKHADVTLSEGNLKAENSGAADRAVRANLWKTTGKFYFELTLTDVTYCAGGVGAADGVLTTNPGGTDTNATGVYQTGGQYADSPFTRLWTSSSSFVHGAHLCIAVDIDAGKVWYGKDGVWLNSGDPAAGTDPAATFAAGTSVTPIASVNAANLLANFGASAFAHTVPSGFDAGWYDPPPVIEETIEGSVGVKAEMTALHFVDDLAPETGIEADFDGFVVSLIGNIAPEAGVKAEFEPLHLVDSFPAGAGIKAAFGAAGSEYLRGVQAAAGVQAEFAGIQMSDTLPAAAGTRMVLACGFEYLRSMAAEAGVLADFEGFNWSDFLRVYRDRISIRYKLTLSDGILDDIDIPISSFQGRFRTGDPTFLSVVVPGNDQYEDITDRDEGDLILTMQYLIDGVVYHSEEICTVDLEDIRIDEGAGSVSVTLSGHRTVTHIPKTTQLTGESYKAVYGGKIRYRCTPDLYLRPGDICIVGDDTFTAGVITWMVNPSYVTMEVEEAEDLA